MRTEITLEWEGDGPVSILCEGYESEDNKKLASVCLNVAVTILVNGGYTLEQAHKAVLVSIADSLAKNTFKP